MNLRSLLLFLLCLSAFSCDSAKKLANRAKAAVENKITGTAAVAPGTQPSAELQKLVDQTAEGVIFRKDLAFPKRLEVKTTNVNDVSGRFTFSSEIEKSASGGKSKMLDVSKLELEENHVRYTVEQSSVTVPGTKDAGKDKEKEKGASPAESSIVTQAPPRPPISFFKTGKGWKSESRDEFRAAVISKQLSPVLDTLLIDNALASRPIWFSKRRFKVGDSLTVSGDSLPMLLAGNAKGSFTLKLESFEAVAGHPCGVFSVKGDFSRKNFPNFEGEFWDEDVTIESGKMWLSLLYPLILREEMDTIQSTKTGGQGGQIINFRGTVKVSRTREWKAK